MSFKKIFACLMLGAAVFISLPELDMNVAEAMYASRPVEGMSNVDKVFEQKDEQWAWVYIDKSSVKLRQRGDEAEIRIKHFVNTGKHVIQYDWATFWIAWHGGFAVRNLSSDWELNTDTALALAQYMNDRY